ncbi:MAG: sigma factor-like helix-turn-helix DNA-binding protein [Patescibacteria group bacterium]
MIEQYKKVRNRLNLKPRYIRIFEFRHGIDDKPHTLKESGKMFNISPERVRQIIARVLYELEKLIK